MADTSRTSSDRYCYYLGDECFYQNCKECFHYRGSGEEFKEDEDNG